jgi:hypothetical protein
MEQEKLHILFGSEMLFFQGTALSGPPTKAAATEKQRRLLHSLNWSC